MQVLAIRTQIFKPGDDLVSIVVKSLRERAIELKNGDILAISSKVVASAEKRVVSLREIQPSEKARELANKYSLEPEFAELVLRESEKIYGGVHRSLLTLKNGILTVNAGVDNKNAPVGYAALWPLNPQSWADEIRKEIERQTGKNVGIVVVDSQVVPLRMGTRGLALAASGFKPVEDCRGKEDLFQKTLVITRHSVADDLASAAHLLMGEADEQTPAVLVRDAPVIFTEVADEGEMKISPEECVYMRSFYQQQDHYI
jgi:coenzyme F420-0:L-glutamate ligase